MPPKRSTHNKRLGDWGEERAAAYLEHLGYTILHRQWRLHHRGEIDIIAMHLETLIFVEVKTRQAGQEASGYEALTIQKKTRMTVSIDAFLQQHTTPYGELRVDWIIVVPCENDSVRLNHIKNVDLFEY